MAKDKQLEAHKQGIAYAYKLIKDCEPGKEKETLEKEIKFRGLYNVPITVPRKEVEKFVEETKLNTLQTMLAMCCMTLHDEFDFGKTRLQRFINRFNLKVECLAEDQVTWQDYLDTLEDETSIKLEIGEMVAGRR